MLDRSADQRPVSYTYMMVHIVIVPEELADPATADIDACAERFAALLEARLLEAYPGAAIEIEVREGPPWEGSVMVLGAPEEERPRRADTPAMLRQVAPPGGWPRLVHDHHVEAHWRAVWAAGEWRVN